MRERFSALVLLLLLAASPARASSAWRALENIPDQASVRVDVDGKPRVYYRIAPGKEIALELQGPGQLRVVTRAEAPAGPGTSAVAYRVSLREGSRLVKEQATASSASDRSFLHGGGAVCKSRTFTWVVPDGTHRIRISESGAPAVLVRLLVSRPEKAAPPMISMAPLDASRIVTVADGEKLISYYSVFAGKPLRWRIVGPTSLELTSRLDFDPTMRGTQVYHLAVLERGKQPREFEFKTTKATTASYTDLKDRVASKLSRVVVPVEQGTHEFTVELRRPTNGSAEIHARIPEPTAGEEE